MKPLITFPDAQLATRDLLRALLSGRTELYVQGATVSTRVPDWKSDDAPALPYIAVHTDGNFRDARFNGRANVRLSVWHKDDGLGLQLAGLCEALLLASGSVAIRGFSPVTSPIPTSDPDTGDPLSFLSVTARLRPVQIT